jgi:hypothetical protein
MAAGLMGPWIRWATPKVGPIGWSIGETFMVCLFLICHENGPDLQKYTGIGGNGRRRRRSQACVGTSQTAWQKCGDDVDIARRKCRERDTIKD